MKENWTSRMLVQEFFGTMILAFVLAALVLAFGYWVNVIDSSTADRLMTESLVVVPIVSAYQVWRQYRKSN